MSPNTLPNPGFRDHLVRTPSPVPKIEQSYPCEVPRGKAQFVDRMSGFWTMLIATVLSHVILHQERNCKSGFQRVEDSLPCLPLENGRQNIEIPVVVIPEATRRIFSPRRTATCGIV